MNKKIAKQIKYTDEPIDLGKRVDDFLPPAKELDEAKEIVHVTLALRKESIAFFKQQAQASNASYEVYIQQLLDSYAQQTQEEALHST